MHADWLAFRISALLLRRSRMSIVAKRSFTVLLSGFLAVMISLTIFSLIHLLSAADAVKRDDVFDSFVSFNLEKPVIEERKPEKRKKQEEKKPEKLMKMKMDSKPHRVDKPKMDMSLPEMSFSLNSRLSQGMAVAMPDVQSFQSVSGGLLKKEFNIDEVDTKPRVSYRVKPVYPYSAKRRNVTGKVVLKFLVSKSGKVEKMQVVSSEPKGVFDKAAKDAILKWRFKPGIYDKKPVDTWVVAPFDFRM